MGIRLEASEILSYEFWFQVGLIIFALHCIFNGNALTELNNQDVLMVR